LWEIAFVEVVIVDDEPLYLQTTKEIMMTFDREMDIQTSTSPVEAIEMVRSSRPDCVISDYRMPEMDGVEFTRRLRESSRIPVIMSTSIFDENVAEEAFKAGVNDYVMKVNDAEKYTALLGRIRNAVDLHRKILKIGRRPIRGR